ncbi:MAG: hypothetical protein SGPRY_004582 [Prymnesium sp.]
MQPKHATIFFTDVFAKDPNQEQAAAVRETHGLQGQHRKPRRDQVLETLHRCPLIPRDIRDCFGKLRVQTQEMRNEKRDLAALNEEEAQLAKVAHDKEHEMLKQQRIRAGIKSSETHAADLAIN